MESRAKRPSLFYYAEKIRINIVFENHRKSLIQHCERSELCLHFIKNAQNIVNLGEFLKT